METIVDTLHDLCEEESQHNVAGRDSRVRQIEICKERLLGKFFKVKGDPKVTINGEEYGRYLYFAEIKEEQTWYRDYSLTGVVVNFNKLPDYYDMGVGVWSQTKYIKYWLELLEDAVETTSKDFREAFWRMFHHIDEPIQSII